ncbi:hypothetical protein [Pseudomonas sp. GD03696]|uniref:hypothetical protein n=1 Tax=Pseudomonas sp. GD03696 TaxID=2975368 RepID=UPI00244AE3E4|nr:hypothetical protein [Pseudomonas sp. GD03696]MDH1930481.1 hypothetical protein [Pseudomonas sp. GD03696]
MSSTHLRSIPLVLGGIIVLFAISFSSHASFTAIQLLEGPAWLIDPRAIAHLIGFIGVVMGIWFFMNSFAEKATLQLNLTLGSLLPLITLGYFWGPDMLREQIGLESAFLALHSIPLYLSACFCAFMMKKLSPRLIEPKGALVVSGLTSLAISLYWELFQQRFIGVYGNSHREYLQFGQILCDLGGIAIGYALVAIIVSKLEIQKNSCFQPQSDILQDCRTARTEVKSTTILDKGFEVHEAISQPKTACSERHKFVRIRPTPG